MSIELTGRRKTCRGNLMLSEKSTDDTISWCIIYLPLLIHSALACPELFEFNSKLSTKAFWGFWAWKVISTAGPTRRKPVLYLWFQQHTSYKFKSIKALLHPKQPLSHFKPRGDFSSLSACKKKAAKHWQPYLYLRHELCFNIHHHFPVMHSNGTYHPGSQNKKNKIKMQML